MPVFACVLSCKGEVKQTETTFFSLFILGGVINFWGISGACGCCKLATQVALSNAGSLSSGLLEHLEEDDDDDEDEASKPQPDGLILTYEEHEDSVCTSP